jgi:hypothetical protein
MSVNYLLILSCYITTLDPGVRALRHTYSDYTSSAAHSRVQTSIIMPVQSCYSPSSPSLTVPCLLGMQHLDMLGYRHYYQFMFYEVKWEHTSDVIQECDGLNRILSDSVDSLQLFS